MRSNGHKDEGFEATVMFVRQMCATLRCADVDADLLITYGKQSPM